MPACSGPAPRERITLFVTITDSDLAFLIENRSRGAEIHV